MTMIPFYVEKKNKSSGKDRLAVSLPIIRSCYFSRLENKLQILHHSREGTDYLTFHTLDSCGRLLSSVQLTNQEDQTTLVLCLLQTKEPQG